MNWKLVLLTLILVSISLAQEAPDADKQVLLEKQLSCALARLVTPLDNTVPEIKIGELLVGKVDGEDIVACERVGIRFGQCKLVKTKLEEAGFIFNKPAFEMKKLLDGKLCMIGNSSCDIFIKLHKQLIEDKLKQFKIRTPTVDVEDDSLNIGGRISYMLMSIPFRIKGKLGLIDQSIGLNIDSLTVRGNPVSEAKTNEVKNKFKNIIPIGQYFKNIGLDKIEIKSAEVAFKE